MYDCVKNIDALWRDMAEKTVNGVWKHLTPQFVNNFERFDVEEVKNDMMESLVDISKGLQLDLEKEDFEEVLDSQSEELTNEDLIILEEQSRPEKEQEEAGAEEVIPVRKFDTKLMAEAFTLIEKGLQLFENQDPNAERFSKVSTAIRDTINCYQIIYDEKKKKKTQTSLDSLFKPRRASTCAATPDEPGPSTSAPDDPAASPDSPESRPDSPDSRPVSPDSGPVSPDSGPDSPDSGPDTSDSEA